MSKVDVRVAGIKEAILMVECGANEFSENLIVEALELAHREIQPIIALQEQMQREVGKPKQAVEIKVLDSALISQARDSIRDRLVAILDQPYSKENMYGGIDTLKETYLEEVAASTELTDEQKLDYSKAFDEAERLILSLIHI